MPTNLPAEYYEVEERYKAATTTADKITLLEELISTIPKHKGTDKLRADLRRRLSKLKTAAETKKGASQRKSPYSIDKEGAGQVAVIGPANVGKSALVAALTSANPEVADYPFTTQIPMPGMMLVDNVQVQLVDTPPLSRDYAEPLLLDLIRRSDMVLLVIDLQAYPLEQLEETLALLQENRIVPDHMQAEGAEERRTTLVPLHVLVNKTDDESLDGDFEALCELFGDECPMLPVSATTGRHLDDLRQLVYERLDIIRVYSKPPGKDADFSAPFVMKRGGTIEEFASKVHKDFVEGLKSARVWGTGVHDGQMVGRDHVLQDGDVVELRL